MTRKGDAEDDYGRNGRKLIERTHPPFNPFWIRTERGNVVFINYSPMVLVNRGLAGYVIKGLETNSEEEIEKNKKIN